MRKRTRATGNCAFCGRRDSLTYEHATPKWLGKFIHEHFPPENRWEQVAISFGTDRERAQSTKLIQSASPHKAAVVCGECNNGWMRRLEDAVRPILRPLILGKQSELDDAAIRTVATWATKTALIYEFVQPDDAQPAASATDRKQLRDHQRPLPGSGVWLAGYAGSLGAVVMARSTLFVYNLDDEGSVAEPSGLVVTFVYGRLVLRVALVRSRPTYPTRFAVDQIPGAVMLWPDGQSRLTLPVGPALDDVGLEAFTAMHVAVGEPGGLDRLQRAPGRPVPPALPQKPPARGTATRRRGPSERSTRRHSS